MYDCFSHKAIASEDFNHTFIVPGVILELDSFSPHPKWYS